MVKNTTYGNYLLISLSLYIYTNEWSTEHFFLCSLLLCSTSSSHWLSLDHGDQNNHLWYDLGGTDVLTLLGTARRQLTCEPTWHIISPRCVEADIPYNQLIRAILMATYMVRLPKYIEFGPNKVMDRLSRLY